VSGFFAEKACRTSPFIDINQIEDHQVDELGNLND
jgi:hypothetical protein